MQIITYWKVSPVTFEDANNLIVDHIGVTAWPRVTNNTQAGIEEN